MAYNGNVAKPFRLLLMKMHRSTFGSIFAALVLWGAAGAAWPQNAPPLTVSAARRPGAVVRIELIGDSTQTDNAGYGRGFCANFTVQVECLNFAKGGSSTKTFRRDGIWDQALAAKPDYMLIQFGHNDMVSAEHSDRQVPLPDYIGNLRAFVAEARQAHVTPILVTPITRRYFGKDGKIHSDLTAYAEAMMQVAAETHTPLIDLQKESIAYLDSVGETEANQLGITKKDKDGSVIWDKTHLNWEGSYVFGRMVAADLGKVEPELAKYVLPRAAELPPEGQLAMRVIRKQPFKLVIVGDSAASGTGWAPGFCATVTPNVTCAVLGERGASSGEWLASGRWRQALAVDAQYYFLNFGSDKTSEGPDQLCANLPRMIDEVRRANAIPILLSPLAVDADGRLHEAAGCIRGIAAEQRVTYVDLYGLSSRFLESGQGAGDGLVETGDKGPLTAKGSALIGRLVADNVIRTEVELGPNVNGLPEGAGPVLPQPSAPTDGH
jgi:lysophospholipase L1-like esterase